MSVLFLKDNQFALQGAQFGSNPLTLGVPEIKFEAISGTQVKMIITMTCDALVNTSGANMDLPEDYDYSSVFDLKKNVVSGAPHIGISTSISGESTTLQVASSGVPTMFYKGRYEGFGTEMAKGPVVEL